MRCLHFPFRIQIMSQIVGVWEVMLNGRLYQIEFEHGTTSGRRIIRVDGKVNIFNDKHFILNYNIFGMLNLGYTLKYL